MHDIGANIVQRQLNFANLTMLVNGLEGLVMQTLAKLIITLPRKTFMKWELHLVKPIKPVGWSNKEHINIGNYKLCY